MNAPLRFPFIFSHEFRPTPLAINSSAVEAHGVVDAHNHHARRRTALPGGGGATPVGLIPPDVKGSSIIIARPSTAVVSRGMVAAPEARFLSHKGGIYEMHTPTQVARGTG